MKLKEKIIIGIIFIVVSALIAVQFRSVQRDYLYGLLPSKRSDKLLEEINELREDKVRLTEELANQQQKLDDITANAADESALIKNLQLQLERYRTILGLNDVVGEGVVVFIDNGIAEQEGDITANIIENTYLVNALVNELNAAGAEAISVNDQRIIASTAIRKVGDEISINGKKFINPLIIKAIGDKAVLYSAIGARFQIVESLRNAGYQVELRREDDIVIVKYDDVINWRYAKPVEE